MNEFIMQMRPMFDDEEKKAICGDIVMEKASKLWSAAFYSPTLQ
jgi:hypothetical protein